MRMDKKSLKALKVDAVMCISLIDRADRRKQVLDEFEGSGLEIEFFIANRDVNPERGCFNSHQACAFLAIQKGYRNVLILEDDVTLERVTARQVRRINRFLKGHEPEIFFLGAILGHLWLTRHAGVVRCRAKGAHAYILSKEGCQKLLTLPFHDEPIDVLYSRKFKGYCAFPMLCQQRPSTLTTSDIAHFRPHDSGTTEASWRRNWRKQYTEVLRNLPKSLFNKD